MLLKFKTELKQLAPIGIPAVFSQLAQMATGFIDTIMSGHYSAEALAAVAIGTSLLHPVMIFFLGLFLAFNPITAHFYGANKNKQIKTHFHASIVLALLCSPLAVLILLNSAFVLDLLNIDPQISLLAMDYLTATQWGMPALLIFFALRFCNEGMFATLPVMIITIGSIPFNALFNYWFIYGGLGVSEMGAVGVGYATALTWLVMLLGIVSYTLFTKKYKQLHLFKDLKLPEFSEIRSIFTLGIPIAITLGFEVSMFAAVSLMIARYPVEVMGAHQIALNIASLTFMIPLGLSQAITARVSYFSGKKETENMRLAGNTGIITCVIIMIMSSTIMLTFPQFLVSIYTPNVQLIEMASSLLVFAALFQFSDGIQVSSAGSLRGLHDTKIPLLITAISYWLIGFPAGYYLAEYRNYNIDGYWIGMIIGLTVAAILLLSRWFKISKKLIH